MLKALGFSKPKREAHNARTDAELAEIVAEGVGLEQALLAMDAVLNGRIDEAQRRLDAEDGVYKKIATGVLHFIQATVSFEADAILQAVHSLGASESAASKMKDQARASGLVTSIFRPGTEYELVELESSLLCAVSLLLTESKLEILKALYKIRKTYLALEELRKHVYSAEKSQAQIRAFDSTKGTDLSTFRAIHKERTHRLQKPTTGNETPADTIEEYVRSGVEACSGLLHLILSSVPPTIAKLLSVVGLHGDRETALKMLWHASTKYRNIHGSLALIALIMFFDSQLQYKDILLPQNEEDAISDKYASKPGPKTTAKMTPRELHSTKSQLLDALHQQRVFYPNGVLWLLQEGRMVTLDDLAKGVAILESPECGPNQMRQVEGLLMFDRTMFLLSLDRLDEAKTAFIDLMSVSTWSHPLYLYLSAACHLELYRMLEDKTSPEAVAHKAKIDEYLKKAPNVAKKKVLGKKMPFDHFVTRKVEEIIQVSERNKLDIADAIGTSLLYEALYFWNAPTRMSPEVAARALERLSYSAKAPLPEARDQKFTRLLLSSIYMRQTDQKKEGFDIIQSLTSQVVSGDVMLKGGKVSYQNQKQPWAGPAALYERAIYEFAMNGPSHAKQVHRWLNLSADWPDDYELSTRISMKVTGARDRLDIYRL